MSKQIHFPTAEESEAWLKEVLARQGVDRQQRRQAAIIALEALEHLVDVMRGRSGQPYKVRAILYSLWNGKPVAANELLGLDWDIKQDLCAFMLGFGFEDDQVKCFYKAIADAVTRAGQWDWFIEERFEYRVLDDYAKSCKAAAEEAGR
jgi:hypothetical protein